MNNDLVYIFIGLGIIFFIIFLYNFMTNFKKAPPDSLKLEGKYSPEMNRFAAERERAASEARSKLAGQISSEIASTTSIANAKIDSELLPEHHRQDLHIIHRQAELLAREREETHRTFLKSHENQRIVIDEASNQRLTPPVYELLVVERNKIAAELEKKRLLDQLDVEKEREMAKVELEMVDRARLAPYQELELIRMRIDSLYKESEEVWSSNLPDTLKARRIELLEKTITFLEETYYEKQGLLQGSVRRGLSGVHEEAEHPVNHPETERPTEE
jgi:hypothetical protein